jgi:hypothetical protein
MPIRLAPAHLPLLFTRKSRRLRAARRAPSTNSPPLPMTGERSAEMVERETARNGSNHPIAAARSSSERMTAFGISDRQGQTAEMRARNERHMMWVIL